jgi:hypothetical protein
MHLHGHRNKTVPFMKLFILPDLSNDAKFHNCIYWSTNDIGSHHLMRWVSNHHIDNEDLGHVDIGS